MISLTELFLALFRQTRGGHAWSSYSYFEMTKHFQIILKTTQSLLSLPNCSLFLQLACLGVCTYQTPAWNILSCTLPLEKCQSSLQYGLISDMVPVPHPMSMSFFLLYLHNILHILLHININNNSNW